MKIQKPYISIIICTFNREENLRKIIKLFNNQVNFVKDKFEVIICDSNSNNKLKIKNFIKNYLNLNISYYVCKINHQAVKRNFGAKKARGKFLIFIDDDCFPESNFLFTYYKELKLNKIKVVYCGQVKYIQYKKISNLINYRQSRLISNKRNKKLLIYPKNFISMNMALNKNNILFNTRYLFDSRFRFYGFEDFELAYRLCKWNYKIYLISPLIYHNDKRNFYDFLKKYHSLAKYGIEDIKNINYQAAKSTIYLKIENFILTNFILRIPKIQHILNFIEKMIIQIESKSKFYLPALYNFGIFVAYLKGLFDKKIQNIYQIKKIDWYK